MSGSFSIFADLLKINKGFEKYPNSLSWLKIQQEALNCEKVPPVIGIIMFGNVYLQCTTVDMLKDLYVNKNATMTKHWIARWQFHSLLRQSIVLQGTEHPTYAEKRKALSGAFFKSKLIDMTKIIKEVTLKEIKNI